MLASHCRCVRSSKQLELRAGKQTTWQRIRAPQEVPLVTTFQPRTLLRMEQVVDLQPGALFDYVGVLVGQTPPMPGVLLQPLRVACLRCQARLARPPAICGDQSRACMLAGGQSWLFLADDSCTSGQDDLLAVQLLPGTPQAVPLAVVQARDLELDKPDVPQVGAGACARAACLPANRLTSWCRAAQSLQRALMQPGSSVAAVGRCAAGALQQRAQRLADWAHGRAAELGEMQGRVQALVG